MGDNKPEILANQRGHTLFIKLSKIGEVITLLLCVDDIIIIGDNEKEKLILKQCMTRDSKLMS